MVNRFEYLKQLLAQNPNDSFVLFAIAKEYEGQGADADALEFYLKLQQIDPNYVGLYYHLGKLYEKQGDFNQAILTYKQGIVVSQKAGDRHAASEIGEALLNLEDPDDE